MSIGRGLHLGLIALAALACGEGPGRRDGGPLTTRPTDSLFASAESLYRAGEYDSARSLWSDQLASAQRGDDPAREALILTELGLVHWRLGDLHPARQFEERAIALQRGAAMAGVLSRSQNALCLILRDIGELRAASDACMEAIGSAREVDDRLAMAKASGNLGLVLQDLGDLHGAREAARGLRSAGHSMDSLRLEANGLANEASVDIWEGDPRPGIARLDTALSLYRRIGYSTGRTNAFGQLATAYQLTGEFDLAFAAFDSALVLARQESRHGEEADLLRLTGGLHATLGDWRRAIRQYEAADSLFAGSGFEPLRGDALRGMAVGYLALGNTRRAELNAREASRLHAEFEAPFDQLDDLLLLAEIEAAVGNPAAAAGRIAEARRIANGLSTRSARIAVGLGEAGLADLAGDPDAVLRATRSLRPDFAAWDNETAWQTDTYAARAYGRLGLIDSAVNVGRRAVTAVERLRSHLSSEPLRAAYVTDRAAVYGDLVLALLRQGRVDEAFEVADRGRSRGLLEHLSEANGVAGLPRQTLEEDALLRRIDLLLQRLRETERARTPERGLPDAATRSLREELDAAQQAYETHITRTPSTPGSRRALALLGIGRLQLDDVRSALEPEELLLEYLVTGDRLVVFALTRNGLQVVQTELDGSALVHRIRLLRDLWGVLGDPWRDGLPAARALYRTLITPLRSAGLLQGASRLVVVPMGVLTQVPFAAIQDSATGRYLAEDYTVTTLPLAAALPELRRRVAALDTRDQSGAGFAPFPTELPATEDEVNAFGRANPTAALRFGAQAAEPEARRALSSDGPVHFATHGILNSRNAMFTRIELARPMAARPEDDGRLEVHEILGLSIGSPLVFFSGCETGLTTAWTGNPTSGTEDLSLAQAVLASGASNVISTLWRIDDTGAAVFAGRFYSGLGLQPVREAFATAQRAMMTDSRYASPYYWAGYLLNGEGRFKSPAQPRGSASVSLGTTPSSLTRPGSNPP